MNFISRTALFIIIAMMCSSQLLGQLEYSHWYFGLKAGLRFNQNGTGTPLTDGKIDALEGCATISDANGNLLFYSNGYQVWNRNHVEMPNGEDLLGTRSTTQSTLIIPNPCYSNIYYLITQSGPTQSCLGVYYSVIDMTLDNGLGDVTDQKNIPLISERNINNKFCPVDEKMVSSLHANGQSIWLLIAENNVPGNKKQIRSYLVTENGIDTGNYVTSQLHYAPRTGGSHGGSTGFGFLGEMDISQDGKKIALAAYLNSYFVIANFNSSTGRINNPIVIDCEQNNYPYGIEISPNGKLLYLSLTLSSSNPFDGSQRILQYSIESGDSASITNSKFEVLNIPGYMAQSLQTGIDNKIYYALRQSNLVGVINAPDSVGSSCRNNPNQIKLPGYFSFNLNGLPNKVTVPQKSKCGKLNSASMGSDCYVNFRQKFSFLITDSIESLHWDFGDPSSGNLNSSSLNSPVHTYKNSGTYSITLTVKYIDGTSKYYKKNITLLPSPFTLNLQDTMAYCGHTLELGTCYPYGKFFWNTGDTSCKIKTKNTGKYLLTYIDNNDCIQMDSTLVITFQKPLLPADTSICDNNSLPIHDLSKNAFDTYSWSTGENTFLIHGEPGNQYILHVKDSLGCEASDTMFIETMPSPKLNLGSDTTLCIGDTLFLKTNYKNGSVLWQDGSTDDIFAVFLPGKYSLLIMDSLCSASDTIQVSFEGSRAFIPNTITTNNDQINDIFPSPWPGNPYYLEIYSRWGELLYNGNKAWDGQYQGQIVQEGVYAFMLTYIDCAGNRKHIKGTLNVLY